MVLSPKCWVFRVWDFHRSVIAFDEHRVALRSKIRQIVEKSKTKANDGKKSRANNEECRTAQKKLIWIYWLLFRFTSHISRTKSVQNADESFEITYGSVSTLSFFCCYCCYFNPSKMKLNWNTRINSKCIDFFGFFFCYNFNPKYNVTCYIFRLASFFFNRTE